MSAAASKIDAVLAALAEPSRRKIVDLLGEHPCRAGELAGKVGLTLPATSRHLKVLRDCGLVETEHPAFDTRVRIYSLAPGPLAELRSWLEATEKLWTDQLAAFKAHVERGRS